MSEIGPITKSPMQTQRSQRGSFFIEMLTCKAFPQLARRTVSEITQRRGPETNLDPETGSASSTPSATVPSGSGRSVQLLKLVDVPLEPDLGLAAYGDSASEELHPPLCCRARIANEDSTN